MKLWTNWCWKRRNATSSGAEVMSVAAVMIDQSTPWSVEEKICKPTVSGREITELVAISGHRKLFQWGLGLSPAAVRHRLVHAAQARASQPKMKASPPSGVMAPSARTPVTASR